MIAQPLAMEVGLSRSALPRLKSAVVPPNLKRTFRNIAVVVFAGWTMLVLGVVMSARTGATPHAPDLPQRFLPGNPLPGEAACMTLSDEHIPRCVVHQADYDVYFNFNADTRIISRTVIPAQQYTLGELMAAWGNPTGLTWNETNIYIYWGTHSALLYASSFQPNSRVDFILYELERKQAAPWPGFTSVKR
jgi:hypothetical protein